MHESTHTSAFPALDGIAPVQANDRADRRYEQDKFIATSHITQVLYSMQMQEFSMSLIIAPDCMVGQNPSRRIPLIQHQLKRKPIAAGSSPGVTSNNAGKTSGRMSISGDINRLKRRNQRSHHRLRAIRRCQYAHITGASRYFDLALARMESHSVSAHHKPFIAEPGR